MLLANIWCNTQKHFISCFLLLCQHWYRRRRAVMHWVHSWNINCLEQFCICLLLLFWTSQHTRTYTLESYCRPAWDGPQKIFPSTILSFYSKTMICRSHFCQTIVMCHSCRSSYPNKLKFWLDLDWVIGIREVEFTLITQVSYKPSSCFWKSK